MSNKDTYFLTESVSLGTQQLIQRGIRLDKDRREFQYDGEYTARKHLAWVEYRRKKCQERGWLAKDIIKSYCDQRIWLEELNIPHHLIELLWKLLDSPTGTPYSELIIDDNISALIYQEIQIPIISWIHEKELIRISRELKRIYPNKDSAVGKIEWEYANFIWEVIEGWFIRNKLEIPKIEYPGITLSKIDRCFVLFKEAAECGPQKPEKLEEWKQRFKEFKSVYVTRCAEKYVKIYGEDSVTMGRGSNNGLEWRKYIWP